MGNKLKYQDEINRKRLVSQKQREKDRQGKMWYEATHKNVFCSNEWTIKASNV